ncbi:MAG: DUF2398 family protein [Bacillota bacterium]
MPRETRSAKMQAFVDLIDLRVVLAAREPESFQRIIRYESELRDWFRIYPGYHLERNREMVRLVRTPACLLDGLGLAGLKEPLDYLLFTLVLYSAEDLAARSGRIALAGNRFLLSFLAEEVLRLVQGRYGADVLDFGNIAHRRSLQRVMNLLEELGGLVRLDGSAGEWAERSASADGLYAFTEVTSRLASGPLRGPLHQFVATASPTAVRQPPLPVDDVEQRAWRALLMHPVLLAIDDPEAYGLVVQKQTFIGRELHETFGWRLDLRRGMARVVRDSHAQDAGYVIISPRHRSEYGPVLLLCGAIQTYVATGELQADEYEGIRLPYSRFCDLLMGLREQHRDLLAGGLSSCGPEELIERSLSLMRENGMARGPSPYGDIYLTPITALYRGYFAVPDETAASAEEGPGHEQLRLFD